MTNSINSLVPNEDAELALLWELYKAGGEGDTGDIVYRAMAHFPVLQTPTELNRETPSGRPWWPGRFRFDLSRLGKKRNAEVQNVKRGSWRITGRGTERLKRASYRVEEKKPENHIQKEGSMGSEVTVTEKLMDLWMCHVEGGKATVCQQVSERIFSLLSLAALPETKPIFDKLWEILDFDELHRMTGSYGVTGFWGKDTFLKPF